MSFCRVGHFAYSGAAVNNRLDAKMGKLYAMQKFVERFRRKDEETAIAAALQLSNIDATQEKGVPLQESAKKSAPPKLSQGETSSKKPLSKN